MQDLPDKYVIIAPVKIVGDYNVQFPWSHDLSKNWRRLPGINRHSAIMYDFFFSNDLFIVDFLFKQMTKYTYFSLNLMHSHGLIMSLVIPMTWKMSRILKIRQMVQGILAITYLGHVKLMFLCVLRMLLIPEGIISHMHQLLPSSGTRLVLKTNILIVCNSNVMIFLSMTGLALLIITYSNWMKPWATRLSQLAVCPVGCLSPILSVSKTQRAPWSQTILVKNLNRKWSSAARSCLWFL